MDWDTFEHWSLEFARWSRRYRESLRDRPVRPPLHPGATLAQLPATPPEQGEDMATIFADFEKIILPGMTHWQHPRFFAYFPANAAPASVLAEQLANAMAAQCMLWQTSPAATELETRMMEWLGQAVGLPNMSGVIQDSASSATLAAVLVMRERALDFQGNRTGLAGAPRLRIYCSDGVHSSIDRALWVSGIGTDNLVRVPATGPLAGMDPPALAQAIARDRAAGHTPAGVILSVGGTAIGATDPIAACIEVAKQADLYTHIDAAWAGSAMICPEFRHYWTGAEGADSLVFNPHKWLGAQFDCAAHFVADPDSLRRTLAINPDFLQTPGAEGSVDYSEWSIPLGRRFRALKLWFLLRVEGVEVLRTMIRTHVTWAKGLHDRLAALPQITIQTAPMLSLFTFRHNEGDAATADLLNRINADGRIYLTQTTATGHTVIRFQAGSFEMTQADADTAYDVIAELSA
ncbi:pyridoxal-dependent decarboxylase [Actibacterium sp. 188UL27-1]|uniref:pyridoxal phosphate-dependent decarboxylase family protein n=1 Tax=Actibacterium sp. 188UL27-1 TaxID=2786961 RepID=UPI0019562667|nr:pyridoxal-dependent decarboxylase [Actibacterium sp. 188UL27-1]MBM7069340.1 aspartate aminotransferase family protein [Actibacterium sp. 188UL27-1]